MLRSRARVWSRLKPGETTLKTGGEDMYTHSNGWGRCKIQVWYHRPLFHEKALEVRRRVVRIHGKVSLKTSGKDQKTHPETSVFFKKKIDELPVEVFIKWWLFFDSLPTAQSHFCQLQDLARKYCEEGVKKYMRFFFCHFHIPFNCSECIIFQ